MPGSIYTPMWRVMSNCRSAAMFDDHCKASSLMPIDEVFMSDEVLDSSSLVSEPSTHFSIITPADA